MGGGDAHHGDASEPGRGGEAPEEVCRYALPALVGIDDKLGDPANCFCEQILGATTT